MDNKFFIWFDKNAKEYQTLTKEEHKNRVFTIKTMNLAYKESKNPFLKTDHLVFIKESTHSIQ